VCGIALKLGEFSGDFCERQAALEKYETTTCMKQKNNVDGGHASSCSRPHGIEVKEVVLLRC
jgi:hypothetical protein